MGILLPTTLSLAAAAAIVNLWLTIRIVQLRMGAKILHGDGGSALLARRMRAHANFVENAPFVLALIAGIELSGRGGQWLAIAGAVFMAARVLHPLGMDSDRPTALRMIGSSVTMLTLAGLATVAVLIALGRF